MAEGARHHASLRIRAALVLAISSASVAAAAATVRTVHRWDEERVAVLAAAAPAPVVAMRSGTPAKAPESREPQVAVDEAPAAAPDLAARVPPRSAVVSGAPRISAAPPARVSSKDGARAGLAPGGDGESALLVGGVQALRRDHDPVRAGSLAEEALRRYPRGVQVEEAMALAMEAAAERGDGPDSRRTAQRYLASYPGGKFADRAARILGAPVR